MSGERAPKANLGTPHWIRPAPHHGVAGISVKLYVSPSPPFPQPVLAIENPRGNLVRILGGLPPVQDAAGERRTMKELPSFAASSTHACLGGAVSRHRLRLRCLLALALAGVGSSIACAASTASSSPMRRTDNRVITQEELETVSSGDLYKVIEQLRPLWLRSGGRRSLTIATEIAVVADGMYVGPVSTLRSLSAANVREIRYLDSAEATAAIPSLASGRNVESAIVIRYGGVGDEPTAKEPSWPSTGL